MRISRQGESSGRALSTADLAAAGRPSDVTTDEDERAVEGEVGRRRPSTPASDITRPREASAQRDEELRTSQVGGDIDAPSADPPDAEVRETEGMPASDSDSDEEALVALFTPESSRTYRSRWISIQSGFVDDPKQAVRSGDELVAQVMTDLANSFADERHRVEAQLDAPGEGSTENLRLALRRYRSFFERLLSL